MHRPTRFRSNLPTQSNAHPVLQHFRPEGHDSSEEQKLSLSTGHSAGDSNIGHMPGRGDPGTAPKTVNKRDHD